jgi:hypothetical protein
VVQNVATNLAGEHASVVPVATNVSYEGIWWKSDEGGWGINLAHQGSTIFATWFTMTRMGPRCGSWLRT